MNGKQHQTDGQSNAFHGVTYSLNDDKLSVQTGG
jgi:hypothetical protein